MPRDLLMGAITAIQPAWAVLVIGFAYPAVRMRLAALAAGPGFAVMVTRTAIDLGLMGAILGRTPPEAMPPRGA